MNHWALDFRILAHQGYLNFGGVPPTPPPDIGISEPLLAPTGDFLFGAVSLLSSSGQFELPAPTFVMGNAGEIYVNYVFNKPSSSGGFSYKTSVFAEIPDRVPVIKSRLRNSKFMVVPLQPIPSQVLRTVLNKQNLKISIYDKGGNLFVDVNSGGVQIITSVMVRNADPIVCINYSGFVGNMIFLDIDGFNHPEYSGLGSRYRLIYIPPPEDLTVFQ